MKAKTLVPLLIALVILTALFFALGGLPADRNGDDPVIPPATPAANIRVFAPAPGDSVGQPVIIVGQARVFENNFNYRVLDAQGHQLGGGFSTALSADIGQFGPFSVAAGYGYSGPEAFVEVFTHSAKDGSEIEVVRIPINVVQREDTVVKVFLDNQSAKYTDPDTGLVVNECTGVFPVFRAVSKTTAVARAALTELLEGPTSAESQAGYSSELNSGVMLRDVRIENGAATVDFSGELMRQVGGSCRVGMMTAQITETLKQFPSVNRVTILVDGKADQLQP